MHVRRSFMVVLWLCLSIASLKWWERLANKNPGDLPIWQTVQFAQYLEGSWVLFLCVACGLAVIYILELLDKRPRPLRGTLLWVAAIGLAAVVACPVGSTDIFSYAAYPHLQVQYGLNPYLDVVSGVENYTHDAFLQNVWWVNCGSPYGPLWTGASYLIYKVIAPLGFIPLLFGFKVFGLIMHLLIAVVVYRLAETIRIGSGGYAAVLYGLNPLAVFELVVNAHNDGLAILLLVTSLYLFTHPRNFLAFAAVGLAAASKLTALLALPFMLLKTERSSGTVHALVGAVGAAFIVGMMYLPFSLQGIPSQGIQVTLTAYISNSILSVPYLHYSPSLIQTTHLLGLIGFVFCYVYVLRTSGSRSWERLPAAVGLGYIAYFLLGAAVVHRWYYLWPLALLAVIPAGAWTKVIVVQTLLLMLSYSLLITVGETALVSYCTYLLALLPVITFLAYRVVTHLGLLNGLTDRMKGGRM